jgi:hypothetical protein
MKHVLFLLVFAVLGFTGGITTQAWLAPDGTRTAPAYSFSSETDLGGYRSGSGSLCLTINDDDDGRTCFGSGSLRLGSDGTAFGRLTFDNSTQFYLVNDSTTDSFGWWTDTSTDDMFVGSYGSRFIIGNSYTTTTYMHSYVLTAGDLVMGNSAGTAWTTSQGVGYTNYGVGLDVGGVLGVWSNTSGITSAGSDAIQYQLNGTVYGYSRNKDLLEIASSSIFMTISNSNGAPASTICDASAETGRLVHDYLNNRLYVCNFDGASGWKYMTLTE